MGKDDRSSNSLLQPVSAIKRNRRSTLLLPIEVRADIRAFLAAALASEPPLDVREPNAIRPSVAADRGPMAAPEIRAIDQEAATPAARISPKVIFRVGLGMGPLKPGLDRQATNLAVPRPEARPRPGALGADEAVPCPGHRPALRTPVAR
jgi:hypothetical protein